MPKKRDYEKILHSGNGKQKGLLVANSYAEDALNNKPFLTRKQIMAIVESIRTDREATAYNKVVSTEYTLRHQTFNTMIIYKDFLNELNLLASFSLLKDNYDNTEELIKSLPENFLFPSEQKPHPTKLHLFQQLKKKNIIPLDPFNYGRYLNALLTQTYKRLRQHTVNFKTMIQAITDHMNNTKVKIDIYTKELKEIETSTRDIYLKIYTLHELHKRELKASVPAPKPSPREYDSLPIDDKLYNKARITLTGKDYGER